MAAKPGGLEAGGNHSVGWNIGVVIYLLRFLDTFFFFDVFFFFNIVLHFGLFPFVLIADPLQLREMFAITYF